VSDTNEQKKVLAKRDIFHFSGEKPTAINLEHVTQLVIEGRRITFTFYNTTMFVDLENEEAAKMAFDKILSIWSANVVA
jgi:hypothetical protein